MTVSQETERLAAHLARAVKAWLAECEHRTGPEPIPAVIGGFVGCFYAYAENPTTANLAGLLASSATMTGDIAERYQELTDGDPTTANLAVILASSATMTGDIAERYRELTGDGDVDQD